MRLIEGTRKKGLQRGRKPVNQEGLRLRIHDPSIVLPSQSKMPEQPADTLRVRLKITPALRDELKRTHARMGIFIEAGIRELLLLESFRQTAWDRPDPDQSIFFGTLMLGRQVLAEPGKKVEIMPRISLEAYRAIANCVTLINQVPTPSKITFTEEEVALAALCRKLYSGTLAQGAA
ncbi:MAG: hypothetical protein IBX50_12135 [Marinospirillum sp.]|uniref:hypothetical protein n=1 Tax=Marinospirillum sp. TaxID=2183934 RepID=UPI0019F0CF2E|nr:hypothetical protein [Marinospirillum sp.]MBE0507445.1 hypothetical protein [Marinospirillum sp.]